jgi:hypothetical protein
MPQKQLGAGGTEKILFPVSVRYSSGRKHDTLSGSAVGQAEAVSQLVERRLFDAIKKEFFIGRCIVETGMKPVNGNDGGSSTHLGKTEDIF